MKGVDIIVKGSVGHMSAFMAQAGTLMICGDAGDALGDSIYETVIYLAGKPKSLGVDCIEKKVTKNDLKKIENLIESLSNGAESFDIIVSKRKFKFKAELKASKRQREILLAGGLLNWIKDKKLAYNK